MDATANPKDILEYNAQGHKPFPIDVAIKPDHTCAVVPNVVPSYPGRGNGVSRFAFKVTCPACGWEVLAVDQEQAEAYVRGHKAHKNAR